MRLERMSNASTYQGIHRPRGGRRCRAARGRVLPRPSRPRQHRRGRSMKKHEDMYAGKGIDTYHGRARFTGRNSIEVGGTQLESRYVLIAAGAEPVRLNIPGEEHLATNEQFLELDALPARIVLVGGGYVAAEFSHIAARAGAKVTEIGRASCRERG